MQLMNSKEGTASEKTLEFYEQMFNALADRIRLRIISEISKSANRQLCVCDLEEILDLKQSKISYHLKKLVDADILSTEKHGTWNYYKVNESHLQSILSEEVCSTIL